MPRSKVSVDYLISGEEPERMLIKEEQELLTLYRSLTEKEKGKAEVLLEQLAEESAERKEKKSSWQKSPDDFLKNYCFWHGVVYQFENMSSFLDTKTGRSRAVYVADLWNCRYINRENFQPKSKNLNMSEV